MHSPARTSLCKSILICVLFEYIINRYCPLASYFGHGGAEQYVRSHKIRHLQRCAATMLWGCSSGALRDMGDFERIGTPNNYMLAGCPTLVANLWDVTDRDIDKFALSVFDKLALNPEEVKKWQTGRKCAADCRTSIVSAVAQSRDVLQVEILDWRCCGCVWHSILSVGIRKLCTVFVE